MKCTFALTLRVLFSILSLSAVSLGGKVHQRRWHTYTRSRCRTNKKIFPKINREKEKSSGPGSVTYYCETRVEKYRDIQNVRKNISLPSSKENSYRILFNYENVHLSRDNIFVFVKYRVSTENTCVESVEPRWPVKLTIGRLSSRQIVS